MPQDSENKAVGEEEVAEAVEVEEAEAELHNHNNLSRSPRMSRLWDPHPPFTMETELKSTTGSRN